MNFQESVEEARSIEKNALPYETQKKEDCNKLLEIEMQRVEFADLINQYEKVEKIISIYKKKRKKLQKKSSWRCKKIQKKH